MCEVLVLPLWRRIGSQVLTVYGNGCFPVLCLILVSTTHHRWRTSVALLVFGQPCKYPSLHPSSPPPSFPPPPPPSLPSSPYMSAHRDSPYFLSSPPVFGSGYNQPLALTRTWGTQPQQQTSFMELQYFSVRGGQPFSSRRCRWWPI